MSQFGLTPHLYSHASTPPPDRMLPAVPRTEGKSFVVRSGAGRAHLEPPAAHLRPDQPLRATATRRAVDWQHKTTTEIADQYGTVVAEQFNLTNMVRSARGTVAEPGKNVAQKAGLNRSIAQEAWGRMVAMLAYKLARRGGTLHKVPAPGTSLRCSACGVTTPGSRQDQATFVCKNSDCGFEVNADWNAAWNILHLYRIGHVVAVPAAGRCSRQARKRVKPATAR